jgi:peptidoglycan/LPS O-acetylase OafA/YrhL
MLKYRPEIDGLRTVAVVPVVLFHGHIPGFSGGYLGVDIFFVISGFLITQLLLEDLEQERFSVRTFYERRARRILPALFLMLCASTIVGFLILPPQPFVDFAKSLIASVFFVANIYFLRSTDYFSDPSELVPLLHTWSLSVEEQFYLLFPIVLALTYRYARHALALLFFGAAVLVFVAYRREHSTDPANSFYSLQFRSWELLAGATIAAFPRWQSKWMPLAGLLMIVASIFFFDIPVLAVLGTALILWLGGTDIASKILSLPLLVYLGTISYSFYLWHQPIFAFARHALSNTPSTFTVAALILLSFCLSALSTRYVEIPLRRFSTTRAIYSLSLSAALALTLASVVVIQSTGLPSRYSPEQIAILQAKPERGVAIIDGKPCRRPIAEACVIGAQVRPNFAVVGDSHADTLTTSIGDMLRDRGLSAFVFTNAGCPFIAGVIEVGGTERCDKLTDGVLSAIKQRGIKSLILNDRSTAYIVGTRFDNGEGGIEPGASFPFAPIGFSGSDRERQQATLSALRATLLELLQQDVTIYHVLPIPEVGWHVPRTLSKLAAKHFTPITTSLQRYLDRNAAVLHLAMELSGNPLYRPVYPHQVLCNTQRCLTAMDGKILYTDTDHLSAEGAAIVVPEIQKQLEAQDHAF